LENQIRLTLDFATSATSNRCSSTLVSDEIVHLVALIVGTQAARGVCVASTSFFWCGACGQVRKASGEGCIAVGTNSQRIASFAEGSTSTSHIWTEKHISLSDRRNDQIKIIVEEIRCKRLR
jgi:hypothetical protein